MIRHVMYLVCDQCGRICDCSVMGQVFEGRHEARQHVQRWHGWIRAKPETVPVGVGYERLLGRDLCRACSGRCGVVRFDHASQPHGPFCVKRDGHEPPHQFVRDPNLEKRQAREQARKAATT